jgi:hypothetical protein
MRLSNSILIRIEYSAGSTGAHLQANVSLPIDKVPGLLAALCPWPLSLVGNTGSAVLYSFHETLIGGSSWANFSFLITCKENVY